MTDYADLEKRLREAPTFDMHGEAADAIRDLRRKLEERDGFVLMPIEPTEAMIVAGAMNVPAFKGTSVARRFAKERYAAMIAARPTDLSRANADQDDANG